MKAISELPKRGAPISTAVGPSWHSERGSAPENTIIRQQTRIRKPVIRWMSAQSPYALYIAAVLKLFGIGAGWSRAVLCLLAGLAVGQAVRAASAAAGTALEAPAYPLKASSNNRYLVDQKNAPFLMVGNSPQSLIGNLTLPEAALYMQNRARYGINTLWINLLCNDGTACNADGSTREGIAPFRTPGDLATPNPIYFQKVDAVLDLAVKQNMLILLDPIETIGWLKVLRANGIAKARDYGRYLGNRYRRYTNIVWMHGNDFQTWRDMADGALVRAVASGIRSAAPQHLQTIELNYLSSGSLDASAWALSIDLDAAYTYYPTYAQVLKEYNRRRFLPVFLVEANYEFEHLGNTDGGSPLNLRRQEYWTMLSGAAGQLYGSAFTWRFPAGWRDKLDTPGVRELSFMKKLFATRSWYALVPDQEHMTVVDGYGQFSAKGSITKDSYVAAARTADGSLVMAYMPFARTISVDMSRLARAALGRWYDPTNGTYRPIDTATLPNTGIRQFTPPGKNSTGDSDWVLVLDGSPG